MSKRNPSVLWTVEQGLNTDEKARARSNIGVDDAISGAINGLDVNNITDNLGASKTLSALSETDGKISATATSIQIAESQVTNLTTDLEKKAGAIHAHGNITNDGKVGTTANKPLITGTGGVVQAGSFGSSANTFCEGNDSRLSPKSDMYVAEYGVISEFTAMTNARGEGKKICVAVGLGGGSSGFNLAEAIVPLSYVEFGSGGAVVAFYFNMLRDSYGDVNARGSIMQVKCTSTGWNVTSLSPYYADNAGVAGTAGSANTAGSATNATNATNDGAGSEIKSTYVCNAKLVNGGGGTLYPGSSFTVLSGAAIKSDDATIGNRKYVELTYMSYGLGIGTRLQQVGEPYMTYNNPDKYLELSKTAFSIAGRKTQDEYCNALTSQLMGTYHNLIEVDFDYDIVATNSTSSIGVTFCLASTLMAGTPQTAIATNDARIFASATVSGQGVGSHLRGHLHIPGYLQSSQVLTGYGLCIGAQSIYGDYSGTCTLKITNVNIKDSYATHT